MTPTDLIRESGINPPSKKHATALVEDGLPVTTDQVADLAAQAAESARIMAETGIDQVKTMAPVAADVATQAAKDTADWSRSKRGRNTLLGILAGIVTVAVVIAIVRAMRSKTTATEMDDVDAKNEGPEDGTIRAA